MFINTVAQICRFGFSINCIYCARSKAWPCWNWQAFSTDRRQQLYWTENLFWGDSSEVKLTLIDFYSNFFHWLFLLREPKFQNINEGSPYSFRSRRTLYLPHNSLKYQLTEKNIIWTVQLRFRGSRKIGRTKNVRFNNRSTASTSIDNLLYVSGQRHDSDSTCSKRVVISRRQIYLH